MDNMAAQPHQKQQGKSYTKKSALPEYVYQLIGSPRHTLLGICTLVRLELTLFTSKKPRMERFNAHPSKRHEKAEEFNKLARQCHRCYGCGFYVAPGDIEAHRKVCRKDPTAFEQG
jgi:hypothetical protein